MSSMIHRGLKIFFRDKGGIFFSLLGVLIIFALFIFFIGDSIIEGLDWLPDAKVIMNGWVIAGMLASASITTSMGAYALMVTDKEQKLQKDFLTSPISRGSITGGYLVTGFIVSVIMSVIVFVIGEIYIVANGGKLLDFMHILKIFGTILLSSFASSAMVCFLISFVRTINAYTTLSIILGTLIGFLIGAYIPIGQLPDAVQNVVRVFPCTHAAALFRQIMMDSATQSLAAELKTPFLREIGTELAFGDTAVTPLVSILVLVGTGLVFYCLALWNMSRKSKR